MKYIFIDTEGQVNAYKGLKTFGYVLTDETFEIGKKREIYIQINPDGTQREISETKSEVPFNKAYSILRDNIIASDYVIGFAVRHDVDNINAACERFKTPPLDYKFFDVQKLYAKIYKPSKQMSLKACVNALEIDGRFHYHTSKADAYATALVLKKICEANSLTLAECIENNPVCVGYTEKYKAHFLSDAKTESLESSAAGMFKIRVDFPLVCFKKQIGATRNDGFKDGVCYYYDLTLNKLFRDRHPHQVAKAKQGCLIEPYFDEAISCGKQKLEEECAEFYNADAALKTGKYVVSFEFVGTIDNSVLYFKYGEKYLKQINRKNKYAHMLGSAGLLSDGLLRRYYDKDTFVKAMCKNAKWNYGDKNPQIQIENVPTYGAIISKEGDEWFLPRVYEYVLTQKIGRNGILACKSEHIPFAVADKVIDIDSLPVGDKDIKIIVQNDDGQAFAFIPCVKSIRCNTFGCSYDLPLLIRRKLDDNYLSEMI